MSADVPSSKCSRGVSLFWYRLTAMPVAATIPFGGSCVLAARGYVDAALELEAQLPGVDQVVVAVGSGGTMACLVAHLGAQRVVGIDTCSCTPAGCQDCSGTPSCRL